MDFIFAQTEAVSCTVSVKDFICRVTEIQIPTRFNDECPVGRGAALEKRVGGNASGVQIPNSSLRFDEYLMSQSSRCYVYR